MGDWETAKCVFCRFFDGFPSLPWGSHLETAEESCILCRFISDFVDTDVVTAHSVDGGSGREACGWFLIY
jgi:hypothetical protein